MKSSKGLTRSSKKRLAFFVYCILCTANMASAENYGEFIMDGRDYKLEKVDDNPPSRVMDFRFYSKPTYTRFPAMMICGDCLCVTGVFTAQYPDLGIQPTSYSPTFSCEEESEEFREEAELASKFMSMSSLVSEKMLLLFSSEKDHVMVFRMRSDMESCLNWFEHEGMSAVRNSCSEPVQVQLYAPKIDKTVSATVPAGEATLIGLSYDEAEGFLFSACPTNKELTVPFDKEGFPQIRNRMYECR